MGPFLGKSVTVSLVRSEESPEVTLSGAIEGLFGQSGKFRVRLSEHLTSDQTALLQKEKGRWQVAMRFKRFLFDSEKKMYQ